MSREWEEVERSEELYFFKVWEDVRRGGKNWVRVRRSEMSLLNHEKNKVLIATDRP